MLKGTTALREALLRRCGEIDFLLVRPPLMKPEHAMHLGSAEHDEIIAAFDRLHGKGNRLDKEPKSLWPKGIIYQDGNVNRMFLMYRSGYALGKAAYLSTEYTTNPSRD